MDKQEYYKLKDGKWVKETANVKPYVKPKKVSKAKTQKAEKTKKEVNRHKRMKKSYDLIKSRKASKLSAGEKIIADFLTKECVKFKREYYHPELYNKTTNTLLFIDFFLPDYNMAIEFDGAFHYQPIHGEQKLQNQKARDWYKDKFCKRHKIHMVRIPFWEIANTERLICTALDNTNPIVK